MRDGEHGRDVFACGIGGGGERGVQGAGLRCVIGDDDGAERRRIVEDEIEDVIGGAGVGRQFDAAPAALGSPCRWGWRSLEDELVFPAASTFAVVEMPLTTKRSGTSIGSRMLAGAGAA